MPVSPILSGRVPGSLLASELQRNVSAAQAELLRLGRHRGDGAEVLSSRRESRSRRAYHLFATRNRAQHPVCHQYADRYVVSVGRRECPAECGGCLEPSPRGVGLGDRIDGDDRRKAGVGNRCAAGDSRTDPHRQLNISWAKSVWRHTDAGRAVCRIGQRSGVVPRRCWQYRFAP